MRTIVFLLRSIYWVVIAFLPFILQSQYVEFVLWGIKNPSAECMKTGMPFVMHVEVFSWVLMLLLLPLAAWHLGGKYLWKRFRRKSQALHDVQ